MNDFKLLRSTIESVVVGRPECEQHLCLDKGYDNPGGREATAAHGYIPHIRRIGEEKLDETGRKALPARRWVVERTFAWLSIKVPRPARPVREEGGQLPWAHTTRLYAPLVQALPPADSFGIVT